MSALDLDLGENLHFSVKRRFGLITFNRKERGNALTVEMLRNLKRVIEHCQRNEKIRGLILTGQGKAFTTGLDLDSVDASDHKVVKEIETIAGEITKLFYYGKPLISAINGYAMGDGVIYTLASDYRIALKNAYFQMPEINFGIFPGTGALVLASRIIGIPWTRKIFMFAEKVPAELALEIGLIDQIVDSQEELMRITMDKARFLFTKNQTVLNAIKLCCNHLGDKSYSKAYELEKIGSAWYEFEDKENYIKELRKKFD
jgi:enoyl-CoA hydratase/carnithine racemase